jgi:hypothetical protein
MLEKELAQATKMAEKASKEVEKLRKKCATEKGARQSPQEGNVG